MTGTCLCQKWLRTGSPVRLSCLLTFTCRTEEGEAAPAKGDVPSPLQFWFIDNLSLVKTAL